jgi:DNA repair protein SbcD/Mre11
MNTIRLLHTSDWHLGKRLERFSRHEEQIAVLNEICDTAERENVDVVLIAGDLFDTFNPPAESLDLFYKTLKRLAKNGRRAVIAIAGNHDMPERIEAPDPLARECGIVFAGFPDSMIAPFSLEQGFSITRSEPGFIEILIPGKPLLRVLLTPYANEMRLRRGMRADDSEEELRQLLGEHWKSVSGRNCDNKGVNILLSHLLFMPEGGEEPDEPDDERPINHIGGAQAIYTSAIPQSIQYAALGHLHRKQTVDTKPCPVVYCGSPVSYSFSEAGQKKYAILVELEPGKVSVLTPLELTSGRKLERKRFETTDTAEAWLRENPDSLVELTLVSDTFLSGADRRRLNEIHNGIVAIIPELSAGNAMATGTPEITTVKKGMTELFTDYFRSRKGQEPDEALLKLFSEINAQEEEG